MRATTGSRAKSGDRKARWRLQPRRANDAAAMRSCILGAASVEPNTGLDQIEEERVASGAVFAEGEVAAAVREEGEWLGPVEGGRRRSPAARAARGRRRRRGFVRGISWVGES